MAAAGVDGGDLGRQRPRAGRGGAGPAPVAARLNPARGRCAAPRGLRFPIADAAHPPLPALNGREAVRPVLDVAGQGERASIPPGSDNIHGGDRLLGGGVAGAGEEGQGRQRQRTPGRCGLLGQRVISFVGRKDGASACGAGTIFGCTARRSVRARLGEPPDALRPERAAWAPGYRYCRRGAEN